VKEKCILEAGSSRRPRNIVSAIHKAGTSHIIIAKKTKIQRLDGHGRARREAARRGKSEWKVNLGIEIPLATMAVQAVVYSALSAAVIGRRRGAAQRRQRPMRQLSSPQHARY